MHDFFRCFPCTFGTLLVNSVLSLYTQYFPCVFSTFLVYSVLSLYPPSMLHSLVLSGYYVMTKGALKPCLWRKGVSSENRTKESPR